MNQTAVGNGFNIRKVPACDLGSLAKTRQAYYVFAPNGEIVGTIEKTKAQRGHVFPWQAFIGRGMDRRMLGSVYDENEVRRISDDPAAWPLVQGTPIAMFPMISAVDMIKAAVR